MNLTFKKTMLAMALTAAAGLAHAQTAPKPTLIDFTDLKGKLDAGFSDAASTVTVVGRGTSITFGKEAVDVLTDDELDLIAKRNMGSVSLRDTAPNQASPLVDVQDDGDALSGRWITVRPGTRVQADNYIWIHLAELPGVQDNSVREPAGLPDKEADFAISPNNQLRLVDIAGNEVARFAKAKTDKNGNYVAIQFQFMTKWPADGVDVTGDTALSIAATTGATAASPEYVVNKTKLRAMSSAVSGDNASCYAGLVSGFATQSNTSTLPELDSKNTQNAVCVRKQFSFVVTTGSDKIDVNQDRKYFVDDNADFDYTKADFGRENRRVAKEGKLELPVINSVDYGFNPTKTEYRYMISAPQAAQTALMPLNPEDTLFAAAAYSSDLGAITEYYPANEDKTTNLLKAFCPSYALCADTHAAHAGTHRPANGRTLAQLNAVPEWVRLSVKGEVVHSSGIKDPNQWVIADKDYTMNLDVVTTADDLSWTPRNLPVTLANNKIISWEGNGSNVYIPYMPYRAENMGQVINLKNWSDTQVGKVKASIVLENGVTLPEVTVGTLNAKSILMASGPIRAAIDTYRAANNVDAATVTRAAITLYSGASLDKVEVFSAYNNGSSTAVVTNSSNKSDDKAAVKQSTHFNCTDTGATGGNTSCKDENVTETP